MKFLRIGIFALVVFGVAAHGAAEDWARAVLETGAGLLFLAWAVQQYFAAREIVLSPLLPPLLALSLVALGQIVFHGTASAYGTRLELQLLLAYAVLLFLASQAFRTAEDWRGFVWFVMSFGFLVAIFGLLPIGALFLSASRGGMLSFAAEIGVLALLMVLRRAGGRHVLAGGVVLLLAFLLVSWLGVRQILERFSSMQSLEVTVGKRATMRQDAWHMFLDHPWTGTGLGTLPLVFPAYESLYDGKIVNHAHNDYLEMLADTGLAGALCCTWFIG